LIIGKIKKNEKKIEFELHITCVSCKRKVPGGMKTSEKYYGTDLFCEEIKKFRENYLCGRCRDEKRILKNRMKP